ncbi:MAG: 2-amino-4-hydroxy-6-hydroxymethyldihydropteridine diphosphokinase [Planctomycetes bacterium]|nr:2-amino-4-hydroxy-6-hydroxymethyldihydropteridine diphosphokinase [Planctomycetota bacterium]
MIDSIFLGKMCPMSICYLSIGSNLGDRIKSMSSAIRAIAAIKGIEFDPVADAASLYESSPVGVTGQSDYLNSALRLRTNTTPWRLLEALQSIESSLGRVRSERWASRTIDLDLLLYGDTILNEPDLAIPHPRMHERLFVLEPLAELASSLLHPIVHKTVTELAANARTMRPDERAQRIAGPEWTAWDRAGLSG